MEMVTFDDLPLMTTVFIGLSSVPFEPSTPPLGALNLYTIRTTLP